MNLSSARGSGPHANRFRTYERSAMGPLWAKEAVVASTELAGLTGQQKAAIMMLAIGEDRAGTLFENPDEEGASLAWQ